MNNYEEIINNIIETRRMIIEGNKKAYKEYKKWCKVAELNKINLEGFDNVYELPGEKIPAGDINE